MAKDAAPKVAKTYPVTPDGHYFVVRGRLWRCTNPKLSDSVRQQHTRALMQARRTLANKSLSDAARTAARAQVQAAKEALGERGPVWWQDDGPICDRKMVHNTPYAAWWAAEGGS